MPPGSNPIARATHAATQVVEVKTTRRTELQDITSLVAQIVLESGVANGACHLYVPHTTAGVLINEGDDSAVARDIEGALDRLAPSGARYLHAEGNSDSHIKAALAGNSAIVFIENGGLGLGRWQAIFFCEFDGPRRREVRIKIVADP
jgi:secondary thiamine-phosphate synthase enzyme